MHQGHKSNEFNALEQFERYDAMLQQPVEHLSA